MQESPPLERLLPFLIAASVVVLLLAAGSHAGGAAPYWNADTARDVLTFSAAFLVLAVLLRQQIRDQALAFLIAIVALYLAVGTGLLEVASAALFFTASYLYGRILLWLLFPRSDGNSYGISRPLLIGLAIQLSFFGVLIHVPLNTRAFHVGVQLLPVLLCLADPLPTVWRTASASVGRHTGALTQLPYWYCVVLLMLIACVARYAFFPSITFDDNAAHLRMWTELAANARFSFDISTQIWELSPFAANVLHASISLVADSDARGALNLVLLALLCRQLWAILAHFGVAAAQRLLLVVLLLSTPLSGLLLLSLQTELLLALLTTAGVRIVLQARREWYSADTVALFAVVALCCAVKLPGIALGGLLLLSALVHAWPLRSSELASHSAYSRFFMVCTLAGLAALALNPYAFAWFITGNPVFPLYNGVFKSPLFELVNFRDSNWVQEFSLASYWRMFFETSLYFESDKLVAGFQYLALLPLALLVLPRRVPLRPALVLLIPLLGFGLLMFAMMRYLRYLYPVFPLAVATIGVLLVRDRRASSGAALLAGQLAVGACIVLNFWFYPGISWIFSLPPGDVYARADKELLDDYFAPAKELTARVNAMAPGSQVLYYPDSPFGATLIGDPQYLTWYSPLRVERVADIHDEASLTAFLDTEGTDFVIWNMHAPREPGSAQWLLTDYLSRYGSPLDQKNDHVLYRLRELPLAWQQIFSAAELTATAMPLTVGNVATGGAATARIRIDFSCVAGGALLADIIWDSGHITRREIPCATRPLQFAEALVIPPNVGGAEFSIAVRGAATATVTSFTLEIN